MPLTKNVFSHSAGKWFGPDHPDAGDPPADADIDPSAFEDVADEVPFDPGNSASERAHPEVGEERKPARRAKPDGE